MLESSVLLLRIQHISQPTEQLKTMGCQGCSKGRRKDSSTSNDVEGADGSLVGDEVHGDHEPAGNEDNNEERLEQHYEAPTTMCPEHNYSR